MTIQLKPEHERFIQSQLQKSSSRIAMNRYIISPSASQDLNAIADYFLSKNIEAGENLFQEFNKKCKNLAQFPNLGRSYGHIRPTLRGLPLNGYMILNPVQ